MCLEPVCQRTRDVHEHGGGTPSEELPAVRVVPEVYVVAAGESHRHLWHIRQCFMQRPVHSSYGRAKQNVDGCIFVWTGLDGQKKYIYIFFF